MSNERKKIGSKIKDIRSVMGLSMEKFGELFDPPASKGVVSNWENDYNYPNAERLKKIADLGGISVRTLTEGTPSEEFTERLNNIKQNSSKEERFRFAREMISHFSMINSMLEESLEEEKGDKETIPLLIDHNKKLTKEMFDTILTPEELLEWEEIYKSEENN